MTRTQCGQHPLQIITGSSHNEKLVSSHAQNKRRARERRSLALVLACVALAPFACSQLIGADKERKLAASADGDGQAPGLVAEVPEAGADTGACPQGQKACNGTCVSTTDPEFGCSSESCAPCSLPNAKLLKCNPSGQCAAATCRPGYGACQDDAKGCTFDLTSAETCGSCQVACAVAQVCRQATPDGGVGGGCAADCGALTQCGSSCVDIETTATHCGQCNKACPGNTNGDPTCTKGTCTIECRPGFEHCDGNPSGPCVALQVFYKDGDGDGVGVATSTKKACPGQGGAGWAPVAGDCDDSNPQVRPGQTEYFNRGFTKPGSTVVSFDYDCNGVEQEQPGTGHFSTCTVKYCAGEGLGPAMSGRGGAGVNDYCGSARYYRCAPSGTSTGTALPIQPQAPEIPIPGECTVNQAAVAGNPCH